MSTLQIGLAVAGGVVLAAIVAHSAWTSRKMAPRQAAPEESDTDPSTAAIEPRMEPALQEKVRARHHVNRLAQRLHDQAERRRIARTRMIRREQNHCRLGITQVQGNDRVARFQSRISGRLGSLRWWRQRRSFEVSQSGNQVAAL